MILLHCFILFSLIRIFYYLSIGLLYKNPASKYSRYKPLVSVIIPAWNEEVGIQKTIRSVMNNGYSNFEILVINDGSKDSTVQKVQELKRRYWKNKRKIILISQTNTGKALALNNGISKASGEIIITVDADSYLTPGTIRKLISPLKDNQNDVAIGQIIVGNTKSLLGLIQHFEYMFSFHNKRAQNLLNSIFIFPGALSAFRKKVLNEVGCYENYSCTEDLDLSMRIRSAGHKVVYIQDAICITEGPSIIQGLFNQRVRWRHGFLQCLLHRKDFLYKSEKGKYLSLIELPLSLLGTIEILLFPFFFVYLLFQVFTLTSPLLMFFSFLLLPYAFLLIKQDGLKLRPLEISLALFIPFYFLLVNTVEYAALMKSLYRVCTKQNTAWTVWQRRGV